MTTDLEMAHHALKTKTNNYNILWDYYDGDQPLIYSAKRLQELFRDIDARFSENWCAVVVDSVIDRLDLKRFIVQGNARATTTLNTLWDCTEMSLDSDDAHLGALVTGEGYVIVWPDADGEQNLDAYYNDSRMCHVQYDPARPRIKRWAAKWWQADKKLWRMTLYYPDRLEYYEAQSAPMPESASKFKLTGQAKNPYGVVPVFHLRLNRRRIVGEITQSVRELQNAVNKLLADMMIAAEFGAMKQRYVISNSDTSQLKNAPNQIWDLPAGDGVTQDTQAGEFNATDLANFYEPMERLAAAIGIISRTPKHYFVKLPSHEVSGEALMALEAPLIKKCNRYIERFVPTWRQVATFMLRLQGIEVDPLAITPLFDRPETVQPRTQAEIREINGRAGIPLATTLRDEGRSEFYLEQMEKDRRDERLREPNLAQAYLDQARRGMDQP